MESCLQILQFTFKKDKETLNHYVGPTMTNIVQETQQNV